jgi:hypothetical protein
MSRSRTPISSPRSSVLASGARARPPRGSEREPRVYPARGVVSRPARQGAPDRAVPRRPVCDVQRPRIPAGSSAGRRTGPRGWSRRPRDLHVRRHGRRRAPRRSPGVSHRARGVVSRRDRQAPVCHRRYRRPQRHRIVRRRLRAAESNRLHRNMCGDRPRTVGSADVSADRRRPVSRPRRARALQRRAVWRLGVRRSLLLSESARLRRQGRSQRLLRRRLLPRQSRPHAGGAARADVRVARIDDVPDAVREQRGAPDDRRHPDPADATNAISLGRRHRAARRARQDDDGDIYQAGRKAGSSTAISTA